jgi:hypothetical protein
MGKISPHKIPPFKNIFFCNYIKNREQMFYLSRVKQERSGYYNPPPQKNDHHLTSVERFPGIEKKAAENRAPLKIHESAKDRETICQMSQRG